MDKTLVFTYLRWHYFDRVKAILKGWRNFLRFNLSYFSIPLLLKTLFSHWRKYKWSYGQGFGFGKYLEVFASNLISRTIGAVIRSFLIAMGLLAEALVFLAGLLLLFFWIVLPGLMAAAFLFGIKALI